MSVRLTGREADLMNLPWVHGPSTVAEARVRLRKELAYTTVGSVLRTLESKGAVTRTKEGRAHRYAARGPRGLARQRALAALTARFFRGSRQDLLVHRVENERLDDARILRLRALLDGRRRAGR